MSIADAVLTVNAALEAYDQAQASIRAAKAELENAENEIERAVLDQLGEDGYLPHDDADQLQVMHGDWLITLLPSDDRPAVNLEQLKIVE